LDCAYLPQAGSLDWGILNQKLKIWSHRFENPHSAIYHPHL
jgi:hypothetical protein